MEFQTVSYLSRGLKHNKNRPDLGFGVPNRCLPVSGLKKQQRPDLGFGIPNRCLPVSRFFKKEKKAGSGVWSSKLLSTCLGAQKNGSGVWSSKPLSTCLGVLTKKRKGGRGGGVGTPNFFTSASGVWSSKPSSTFLTSASGFGIPNRRLHYSGRIWGLEFQTVVYLSRGCLKEEKTKAGSGVWN